MITTTLVTNPFPGLRPFEAAEDHLFFGRDEQVDELLRRLRFHRLLAVVGTSGCGKSSLVRCGLVPSLHGGLMVAAGSSWRIAMLRPGGDPFAQLAKALATPEVLDPAPHDAGIAAHRFIEATLRRGARGLVEAVQQAYLPASDNLLVVVDQFEELFRFQDTRRRPSVDARDEAVAFVKVLLAAAAQPDARLYVVLTMRSDFIDECMEYPGLPEALNAGQYLVPSMTRDELRLAITGPVAVAGAEIAPRLVQRLLNDVWTDQDQLPVLQHALMRTWDSWAARSDPRGSLDLGDYEAVGGLHGALSRHAEEALQDADTTPYEIAGRIFRALTDLVRDQRGGRRPCTVAELTALSGAPPATVVRVIDAFRRPGRSFLMPPLPAPLEPETIVDLSHESLMRGWPRLREWADRERVSAEMYLRVARAARWFDEGSAGLWRDPELALGLEWRADQRPTPAWAHRYDDAFDRAMRFLDDSARERDHAIAERRAERVRQWRRLQWLAGALAVLLITAVVAAYVATRESARARAERARAEENLTLARAAVDDSLSVVDREPARLGVDVPEIVGFRRELLEKAHRFYAEFVAQAPEREDLRRDVADAQLRLGHIDRALDARERAVADYRAAVTAFEALVRQYPTRP